jgi:leucyl aminopeptidase
MSPNVAGPTPPQVPSIGTLTACTVTAAASAPDATAHGIAVSSEGDLPADLGLDRETLRAAGFTGALGQTLALPGKPLRVLVGVGPASTGGAGLRDAAAAFARAASAHGQLSTDLAEAGAAGPEAGGRAVVEGILLARYRYEVLKPGATSTPVSSITLITSREADGPPPGGRIGGRSRPRRHG